MANTAQSTPKSPRATRGWPRIGGAEVARRGLVSGLCSVRGRALQAGQLPAPAATTPATSPGRAADRAGKPRRSRNAARRAVVRAEIAPTTLWERLQPRLVMDRQKPIPHSAIGIQSR